MIVVADMPALQPAIIYVFPKFNINSRRSSINTDTINFNSELIEWKQII